MTGAPLVTVAIPARNEAADLGEALAAVLAQSWPRHQLEVLVVDGGSTDETAAVAREALDGAGLAGWAVLDNQRGTTPSNLNVAMAKASGTYLCRVDARSIIPPDYVERCVEVLSGRPEVVVVGGAQVAQARAGAGLVAAGIARALRNPYATGLAHYRRGTAARATDTVYLGAFRTGDLRAAGGWDERFATNQDFELNTRLGRNGLVWFDDRIPVTYRPRPSLAALASQHRRFGRWKAAAWLEGGVRMSPRQAVLLLGPPVAALGILRLRRRHPLLAGVLTAGGAIVVDTGVGEDAAVAERAVGLVAAGAIGASWWAGTVEQLGRWVMGERMLG